MTSGENQDSGAKWRLIHVPHLGDGYEGTNTEHLLMGQDVGRVGLRNYNGDLAGQWLTDYLNALEAEVEALREQLSDLRDSGRPERAAPMESAAIIERIGTPESTD